MAIPQGRALIEQIRQSLYVSAGLFWEAFWALAFGYAFSSLIQVLGPREVIARYLGRAAPKETLLAMLLGPASSSCSFAALSTARALFAKDAALIPTMAFLFGATNLAPPVAALAAAAVQGRIPPVRSRGRASSRTAGEPAG